MSSLLVQILPLALGAAISPTIIAVQILVLTGKQNPELRAWAFAAGALAVLLAIGIPGVFILKAAVEPASAKGPTPVSAWIDLVAGAVLLALAARAMVKKPKAKPRAPHDSGRARLGRYALLGVGMMATNVTTLALYIPALKEIGRSGLGPAERLTAFFLVVFIVMLPATLPPFLAAVAPGPARRLLGSLDRVFARHGHQIAAVVGAAFGVYLLVKGFRAL